MAIVPGAGPNGHVGNRSRLVDLNEAGRAADAAREVVERWLLDGLM